jgi:hypothetical protein
MAFNPNDHMMKLKGKDYLQVAWRLVWFRDEHPDFGINSQALALTEDHAIFKATITDANGLQLSSGHGSESKRDFGDFIEKAETKAIGRALAMLGYGTQFAADELDEGERIVDSPINRCKIQPEPLPEDAQKPGEKVQLPPAGNWNPMNAASLWCKTNGVKIAELNNMRTALIAGGVIPNVDVNKLITEQFDQLIKAIEANYPDLLRKPA